MDDADRKGETNVVNVNGIIDKWHVAGRHT